MKTETFKIQPYQKAFVKQLANMVTDCIDKNKLEIKNRRVLNITDIAKYKDIQGIKLEDNKIMDNAMYVEQELVQVSQRLFEEPIANYPLLDILSMDSEGSTKEALIYKVYNQAGEFILADDKTAPNSIVSVGAKSDSYPKKRLNAYTEDISVYEIAVAIANGVPIQERLLRAVYTAFTKTMNRIAFYGTDKNGNAIGKNALNTSSNTPVSATGTFEALITASNSIGIYKDFVRLISEMEKVAEKADGEFTPTDVILPVKQYGLLRSLMENTGYFQGTIMDYIKNTLGLRIHNYKELKGAGSGGVDRALFLNTSPQNMFVGMPNPLQLFTDVKFDTTSQKATMQTTGFVEINSGAIGYLDGI